MTRFLVAVVVVVLAVGAVLALRRTSMTVHTVMPPGSHLVVEARARWHGDDEAAPRRAHALVLQCVTESASESAVADFAWRAGGSFRFDVTPSLDEPDRRQLRGCLTDLRVPSLLVSVGSMESSAPGR